VPGAVAQRIGVSEAGLGKRHPDLADGLELEPSAAKRRYS
jgi:hypothetical protein